MRRTLIGLGLIVASGFLLACGDDDDGASTGGAGSGGSAGSGEAGGGEGGSGGVGGEGGSAGLDATELVQALQGTWKSGCREDPSDPQSSEIETFTLEGNEVTVNLENFGDSSCGTVLFKVEFKGTIEVGDPVQGMADTFEVDFPLASFTLTMVNADAVDFANQIGFFDFTDWELNTPKDLFGRDLSGDGNTITSDDVVYSIVKVDGDQLFLGESPIAPITAEADRPTALEQDPLLKQ